MKNIFLSISSRMVKVVLIQSALFLLLSTEARAECRFFFSNESEPLAQYSSAYSPKTALSQAGITSGISSALLQGFGMGAADYDEVNGSYYYFLNETEPTAHTAIFSAKSNSHPSQKVVAGLSHVPLDIAIDSVNGTILWIDLQHLNRADLDGSNQEVVIDSSSDETNAFKKNSLTIDPAHNHVYWLASKGIYRSLLDGSNREQLVESGLVVAMTVDLLGSHIYYGIQTGVGTDIYRANLDGQAATKVLTAGYAGAKGIFALWVNGATSKLYYSLDSLSPTAKTMIYDLLSEEITELSRPWFNPQFTRNSGANVYYIETAAGLVESTTDDANISPGSEALTTYTGRVYPVVSSDSQKLWLPTGRGEVFLVNISNGSFVMVVSGHTEIISVAKDSSYLYFADRTEGKIYSVELSGGSPATVLSGLSGVEAIAVSSAMDSLLVGEDPVPQYLFWTQFSNYKSRVGRLDLEAKQTKTLDLVTSGARQLRGIAYDIHEQRLYWAVEAGNNSSQPGLIRSAALNGSAKRTDITLGSKYFPPITPQNAQATKDESGGTTVMYSPRGLAVSFGRIFWSEGPYGTVQTKVGSDLQAEGFQYRLSPDGARAWGLAMAVSSNNPNYCGGGADYIADGISERVVWRPHNGMWYVYQPGRGWFGVQWGLPGDAPIKGDFDGDGYLDLTVWRPSVGGWFFCYSSHSYDCSKGEYLQYGLTGDYPLAMDLDGNGIDDPTVYRPISGQWYSWLKSQGTQLVFQWGLPDDIPVRGDFNGDGFDDPTVWRPSIGYWYTQFTQPGVSGFGLGWGELASTWSGQFGLPGDHPLAEDRDGDEVSDYMVWRPENGTWYVLPSKEGFNFESHFSQQFGLPGDRPMLSDVDGDGRSDYVVWRENSLVPGVEPPALWYSFGSSTGAIVAEQWGLVGDIPLGIGTKDLITYLYY